ncbi:WD40-repeat-containing domain protein [Pelagophyceae sp. CCMP2097]|nr:WD40-repeat-containing domain protein [Pelagophyceae sp. CCMP2097]
MASKLHEWVAHPSDVTCVARGGALGGKSQQVLATGGEDRRTNVWRLRAGGGASNVWSLAGNSSAGGGCGRTGHVGLAFDEPEAQLVAGSAGGGVRIFDLAAGVVSRQLQGHRAAVCCVHAHPFGAFLASGGEDAAVKVWDGRKKACVQTYPNVGSVSCVRFSPDGRWVASGGGDANIRLWDLTAGKLLHCLPAGRTQACSATLLEFSPFEFVLAAAVSDKVVRLFDLEKFEEVGSTPPDSANVRGLCFSDSGQSILVASEDLRQFDWDSPKMRCVAVQEAGWEKVFCLASRGQKATAVAAVGNFVRDLSLSFLPSSL